LLNATWFRVLIVVVVIGAVAAIAVPYVMDLTSTPRPVARVPAAPPRQDAPPPATPPPAAPTAATTTPAAPSPPAAAAAPADKPVAQAPAPEAAKPAPAKPSAATPEAAKPDAKAAAKTRATKAAGTGAGRELWVQVGAFRDEATAKRLAARLKEQGFTVAESTTGSGTSSAPAAGKADKYDVVVSGAAAPELVQKLSAKGLSAESGADGAVIRPSLPLRDAISLSNDLRAEGFKVTVRRVGAAAASAAAPASGETLHRVRVGPFPDRAAASEAAKKLEALGYKPFIARGS
jgi:DedD protein